MKRLAVLCTPPLRELLALLALTLVLLPVSGCVTRGTHREVVEERDQYREESTRQTRRIKLLEASNEALSEERVSLIDEIEDLRQVREGLEV